MLRFVENFVLIFLNLNMVYLGNPMVLDNRSYLAVLLYKIMAQISEFGALVHG